MRVALCVDDFGLKPQVNEAVARLVDAGVVSTVGCMSTGAAWSVGAELLKGVRRDRLDIGLHLNLTDPMPNGAADLVMPLPQLMARSLIHRLPVARLRQTIEHQLERFVSVMGEWPDFIDGHQHVHQMPQVRQALMEAVDRHRQAQGGRWNPWLRCTVAPRGGAPIAFKHRVIEFMGARGLQQMARQRGLMTNRCLLGVYGFDEGAQGYGTRLAGWLAQAHDGDLLMMHPAVGDRAPSDVNPTEGHPPEGHQGDAIAKAREVEYEVLIRDGPALLGKAGVVPVRLSRCSGILDR